MQCPIFKDFLWYWGCIDWYEVMIVDMFYEVPIIIQLKNTKQPASIRYGVLNTLCWRRAYPYLTRLLLYVVVRTSCLFRGLCPILCGFVGDRLLYYSSFFWGFYMALFRPSPYFVRAFIHAYWLMTWTALFGLILSKIKLGSWAELRPVFSCKVPSALALS